MRPLIPALALCLCAFSAAAAQPSAVEVQKRFVGHWRLVTFESFDEKGAATLAPYDGGRIVYDAAGNMSAQLMRSNRARLTPATGGQPSPTAQAERAAAYSTYTAYYGKYSLNPATLAVTHHVEGSVNPNWVKTHLVRYYAFSEDGNRLMLSLENAEGRVTGTLTWERLK